MRKHLTQRFWMCLLFGLIGALLTPAIHGLAFLALTTPFMLLILLSIIDGWWPQTPTIQLQADKTKILEHDLVVFKLTLQSERTLSWVEVELQFSSTLEPQAPIRWVLHLDENTPRTISIPLKANRWGVAGPEWATVITQDRFAVSQRINFVPLHSPVHVYPPAEKLKSLIPLYKERPVTGEHRSRVRGSGSELAEARPYRAGDPVRMVHPRLSARRGEPIVLERHPERSSTIVLLVDSAQDLGIGFDTTLRWTVTAAMALAERHLLAQDRVGMLDIGQNIRWVPARLGRRQLYTLIDSLLASQAAAHRPTITYAMPPNLPKSSTIVAISPLLSEITLMALMQLRTRGHNILVLKPGVPPIPHHVKPLAQRIFKVGNEVNERWLTERGSIVIPWASGKTLEQMMQQISQVLGRSRQFK